MLKVAINKQEYQIDFDKELNSGKINEKEFLWDIIKTGTKNFNILMDNKSYNAEVLSTDFEDKKITIKVNGTIYTSSISTEQDELLKALGMESVGKKEIKEMVAPMPGLVLDILVKKGQKIAKGEGILVLEAMKMENILKSPVDGIIGNIKVEQTNTVNKGQTLVTFE